MSELSEHLDRNVYIYIGNKNIIIYATAIFMPQGSFTLGTFLSTSHRIFGKYYLSFKWLHHENQLYQGNVGKYGYETLQNISNIKFCVCLNIRVLLSHLHNPLQSVKCPRSARCRCHKDVHAQKVPLVSGFGYLKRCLDGIREVWSSLVCG